MQCEQSGIPFGAAAGRVERPAADAGHRLDLGRPPGGLHGLLAQAHVVADVQRNADELGGPPLRIAAGNAAGQQGPVWRALGVPVAQHRVDDRIAR